MAGKKVVVAGATGLVGNAALRHFGGSGGCEVVALSRRMPRDLYGARYVQVDLTNPAQCGRASAELQGATHLVYAALYEGPNLVDGWRDPNQIRTNDAMLRNLMAVLEPVAPSLQHVALLQGTKAYGVHAVRLPCRRGKAVRKCMSSRIFIGRRRIFSASCSRAKPGTGASCGRC